MFFQYRVLKTWERGGFLTALYYYICFTQVSTRAERGKHLNASVFDHNYH